MQHILHLYLHRILLSISLARSYLLLLFHHLLQRLLELLSILLLLIHHPLHLVHVAAPLVLELGFHLKLNPDSLLVHGLLLLQLHLITLALIDLEDLVVGKVPVDRGDVLIDLLLLVVGHSDQGTTLVFLITLLGLFILCIIEGHGCKELTGFSF